MYVDSRPALGRGPRKLPFGTDCASHPRVRHPKSRKRSGSNRRPSPPTSQAKLYGIWSRNELYRTSRPKHTEALGKLVCVTNKRLTIQAQTYAREQAVTGTQTVLHDAQNFTRMSFASQARYSCGSRNFEEHCIFVFPSGSTLDLQLRGGVPRGARSNTHAPARPATVAGLCCEKQTRENFGVVQNGASTCHCLRASIGLRLNCKSVARNGNQFTEGLRVLWS